MRTLSGDASGVALAAEALLRGELVAIPTETVYGLAAIATDARAVARIFAAKERPTFDPLIVHVPPSWGSLDRLASEGLVDPSKLSAPRRRAAEKCMSEHWPGPLTLVLPRGRAVPDLVTSGMDTVGIRMPAHPLARQLLERLGHGLAAPSANRFGRISPTSAQDVVAELGDRVPWVLDGGPCAVGVESTVVRPEADGSLALLRPGGVPREKLAASRLQEAAPGPAAPEASGLASPGMLESHYAPRKPLLLIDAGLQGGIARIPAGARLGLLLQRKGAPLRDFGRPVVLTRALSAAGSLDEAARNLFACLRALDDSPEVDWILAEPCPSSEGLGHAINDRLARASAGSKPRG